MSAARRMATTRYFLAMLGSACLFVASPATAAESLKRVGVHAGFAGLAAEGAFAGFGGAVGAGYGLNDALTLTGWASVSSNEFRDQPTSTRGLVLAQSVGLNYALDIIQVVPYLGLAVGGYEFVDHQGVEGKLGGQFVLGLDFMVTRTWAVGLELRGHVLALDLVESPSTPATFYATSYLKAEYVWGWF